MDPLDRLGKELADRQGLELRALLLFVGCRHAVRRDHTIELRVVDPLNSGTGQDRVGASSRNRARSLRQKRFGRVDESAGGIDDVIDHEDVASLDVADDVHHFGLIRCNAPLIDDG